MRAALSAARGRVLLRAGSGRLTEAAEVPALDDLRQRHRECPALPLRAKRMSPRLPHARATTASGNRRSNSSKGIGGYD
jgi:hypothetical protein